uniref:GDNF family receptor alpha 2 n=1 Tax=Catharus ustulatus TaxID=91951 RepID=A0A8C3U7P7_CATUS
GECSPVSLSSVSPSPVPPHLCPCHLCLTHLCSHRGTGVKEFWEVREGAHLCPCHLCPPHLCPPHLCPPHLCPCHLCPHLCPPHLCPHLCPCHLCPHHLCPSHLYIHLCPCYLCPAHLCPHRGEGALGGEGSAHLCPCHLCPCHLCPCHLCPHLCPYLCPYLYPRHLCSHLCPPHLSLSPVPSPVSLSPVPSPVSPHLSLSPVLSPVPSPVSSPFPLSPGPDEILRSLAGPPSPPGLSPPGLSPPGLSPPGWRVPVDCVRANELCAGEPSCSSRYRTLRQCLAGRDRNTLLANKECQLALEVLQESALYDCRCKRGMRRELQCLQIYWSIHMGLTEGEEFYEASPYEPVTSRLSDIFRLASIFSGMDPAAASRSNHCLDAAKACNLNDNCKRLRSAYISTCSRELSASEPCSRRKCHKALRQFFDRVPGEFTFRLLFCSCKDPACAERRRQTIVPSCSYEDKDKPNCLDLRGACRADHLCRSRLADFHTNCQATFQSLTSCPGDNFQACLGSYAGLIGFDITPNYVDASTTSITISPWCSCKGSGNSEEECEKFLRDFTENPCLRKALPRSFNALLPFPSILNPSCPFTIPIHPKSFLPFHHSHPS